MSEYRDFPLPKIPKLQPKTLRATLHRHQLCAYKKCILRECMASLSTHKRSPHTLPPTLASFHQGPTFCTSALKIETCFSAPGQKTSLTQETELLESLLQEVEHQVGVSLQIKAFFHTVSTSCCSELWDKDVAATLAQQQLHSVQHMLSQTKHTCAGKKKKLENSLLQET